MLVKVTSDIITNSNRSLPETCMVSQAIRKRLKKKVGYVRTTQSCITIGKTQYVVSEGLSNRIDDFDDGNKVKPFTIRLDREKLTAAIAK